jgi:hypothetical protein
MSILQSTRDSILARHIIHEFESETETTLTHDSLTNAPISRYRDFEKESAI